MNKAIEIEELRVSSNGQFIEFVINAPYDYTFTEFTIQVGNREEEYSVADSLFYENGRYLGEDNDNRFIGQIPVDLLDVSGPEIYRIHLAAEHIETNHDSDFEGVCNFGTPDNEGDILIDKDHNPIPHEIYADAYISDVSHAYDCMFDDILSLDSKCTDKEVQDRVIRNYLILYAHQEALRLGYIDEAEKWFGMINQCFKSKCGCGKPDRTVNVGCGCGRQEHYRPLHSGKGCGCGK